MSPSGGNGGEGQMMGGDGGQMMVGQRQLEVTGYLGEEAASLPADGSGKRIDRAVT